MNTFLSGMPELRLGLNDRVLFDEAERKATILLMFQLWFDLFQISGEKGKGVELEDIKFHQCVRLSRFHNDRTISFIPPDGEFDLMTYRLSTNVKPLIWVEAIIERHSHSRVEYMIKVSGNAINRDDLG